LIDGTTNGLIEILASVSSCKSRALSQKSGHPYSVAAFG
jgi:hypothetical protein